MEKQIEELSNIIINYSSKVKKNERVLIIYSNDIASELVKQLIKKICANDGIPFVKIINYEIEALLGEGTNEERINEIVKHRQFEVDNYDCFINIKYSVNDYESRLIPKDVINMIGSKTRDLENIRINQKRWILLNYPSSLDANKAKLKTDEFYEYAMNAMLIDYNQMRKDIKPLKELMEKTDKVKITGPDTDISFSIKGMPVIPCTGESNIPDGEIFVAPIKDSVNGKIKYNTASPYHGHVYKNISLTFNEGRIITATSDDENNGFLEKIFNTDEGSRYIGEFSIGLNPKILYPMGDILYDEKILGSIHFAPGRAYKDSYNGNDSSVHWDIVLIQRKESGGGEIYFDDVLIRKDGFFVTPELKHLNYGLEKK